MKRYWNKKLKQDYGKRTGSCPICEINCWEKTDNKPAIFPRGIASCPHETTKFQQNLTKTVDYFFSKGLICTKENSQ